MTRSLELRDGALVLPGVATTHSHAFQRALRGRTHGPRRRLEAEAVRPASFWSWRGLMYALAERMRPEELYAISHYAFVELAMAGVTTVGEFHYVHHQADGTPYEARTLLADTVVRAALDAGLRIALLRVVYERAGFGRELEPAQRRFVDRDLDAALDDVTTLAATYRSEPRVRVGLAIHSVRAVTAPSIARIATFAQAERMPLHAHVSEQRRELEECLAEHGKRPLELFADLGALDERFVAVHATHLAPHEVQLLGSARAHASICRTTERDLGDGLPELAALRRGGVRLSTGVDSHAASDPFEEARAMELDERTRAEAREVALGAEDLVDALTHDAHAALGFELDALDDAVELDRDDVAMDPLAPAADLVAWHATARAVRRVSVGGSTIVEGGRHVRFDAARSGYADALARVLAR